MRPPCFDPHEHFIDLLHILAIIAPEQFNRGPSETPIYDRLARKYGGVDFVKLG